MFFDMPQFTRAGVVFQFLYRAVVIENLDFIHVAIFDKFQLDLDNPSAAVALPIVVDNRFQRKNLAGVAQALNLVMIVIGSGGVRGEPQRSNKEPGIAEFHTTFIQARLRPLNIARSKFS
jgi:hypothetical protein